LKEPSFVELAVLARRGAPDALEAILSDLNGVVKRLALQYHGKSEVDDARSEIRIGIWKALNHKGLPLTKGSVAVRNYLTLSAANAVKTKCLRPSQSHKSMLISEHLGDGDISVIRNRRNGKQSKAVCDLLKHWPVMKYYVAQIRIHGNLLGAHERIGRQWGRSKSTQRRRFSEAVREMRVSLDLKDELFKAANAE
jgi:hypothetical protein